MDKSHKLSISKDILQTIELVRQHNRDKETLRFMRLQISVKLDMDKVNNQILDQVVLEEQLEVKVKFYMIKQE